METDDRDLIVYLITCLGKIGPNAKETLRELATRLVIGAERYPEDDFTTPRNWNQQAAEEVLDETIYRTREAIRLRNMTRKQ